MLKLIRTHPFLSLGIFIGLALIVFAFRPRAVPVRVAQAEEEPMSIYIRADGQTRIKDTFVVSAPIAGSLSRINLDVGDSVSADTPLAFLEPLPSQGLDPRTQKQADAEIESARAALSAARSEAEALEAEAELAGIDLERIQQLHAGEAAAPTTLDTVRFRAASSTARARSARFRVKVAQHQLKRAQILADFPHTKARNSEHLEIRPPLNGTVLRIMRQHAGPVQTGEPLIEIGNPASLEVSVDVLSEDAVKIPPGTKVFFERWGGTDPLEGMVTRVEPVGFTDVSSLGVDEQRVYIICDLTSPPSEWHRLGSAYRLVARFLVWHTDKALQIPSTCLFRRDESQAEPSAWWVYKVEKNRARLRQVSIGEQNSLHTRIIDGLAPGETVINHPGENLRPGARVELK